MNLQTKIEDLVYEYSKGWDDLTRPERIELSLVLLKENDEHWKDNDEIFTDQIKRMMLEIMEDGDIQNEKLDAMNDQIKFNMVTWCEDDLKYLIEREWALKNREDAMIPAPQEWDQDAREGLAA